MGVDETNVNHKHVQSNSIMGFEFQCHVIWGSTFCELTASYKWTGWAWEMTGWSSRLQENYPSLERDVWNKPEISKGK
jgi:hypothetical protein